MVEFAEWGCSSWRGWHLTEVREINITFIWDRGLETENFSYKKGQASEVAGRDGAYTARAEVSVIVLTISLKVQYLVVIYFSFGFVSYVSSTLPFEIIMNY